jgi:hypothetical protein
MVANFLAVRLFSEVKVGRDGVLKQMHEEKPDQHKLQRLLAPQLNRFGNYIDKRHRHHVPGAQCEKILQVAPRPISPHNEIPANQIPRRRD